MSRGYCPFPLISERQTDAMTDELYRSVNRLSLGGVSVFTRECVCVCVCVCVCRHEC